MDIYDIAQAVADGATVRIFYESRLAKIDLSDNGRKLVEELDKELLQDDLTDVQKAKAKWTQLEALIGSPNRLKNIAKDIVTHFETRQQVFEGKAMVVAMSRRIAAELYDAIMWLTGFDAPCLHTLYIDKPMQGHNLMQAIARVNRVYKDKPGGLVVDYLGIASDLKKALSFYSDSGGKGDPTLQQEQAVEIMLEKLEVISQMFHGFEYENYFEADTSGKLSWILHAEDFILGIDEWLFQSLHRYGPHLWSQIYIDALLPLGRMILHLLHPSPYREE